MKAPDLFRFRSLSENLIFLDFAAARQEEVEERLWMAHGKINQQFRVQLATFRKGEGRKKQVERRKIEKLYLDFIKSSMRFYRGFIQRLAAHFTHVPELSEIAQKFKFESEPQSSWTAWPSN